MLFMKCHNWLQWISFDSARFINSIPSISFRSNVWISRLSHRLRHKTFLARTARSAKPAVTRTRIDRSLGSGGKVWRLNQQVSEVAQALLTDEHWRPESFLRFGLQTKNHNRCNAHSLFPPISYLKLYPLGVSRVPFQHGGTLPVDWGTDENEIVANLDSGPANHIHRNCCWKKVAVEVKCQKYHKICILTPISPSPSYGVKYASGPRWPRGGS